MLKIIVFKGNFRHLLCWIPEWTSVLILLTAAAAADSADAPHVVAVLKKGVLSCSGVLLTKKYVGVACHCIASLESHGRPRLNGLKLDDYDFVAGQVNPKRLTTAEYKRKPRALLTHPYCENEPPIVYDVGVAVMEEPFPTIQDVIEIYDFLSTNSREFADDLVQMFSWKRPEDAPNCTFDGWKILSTPEKNQLMTMEMINVSPVECKEKWRKEDPKNHPPKMNFTFPEQFCLVTRNAAFDETYLPNDGPFVCERGSVRGSNLLVGLVSYGPERRTRTREVPIVTQSLAVMVEWVKYDSYFGSIGCYGRDADDCLIEDKLIGQQGVKSGAVTNTLGSCSVIVLVYTLSWLN